MTCCMAGQRPTRLVNFEYVETCAKIQNILDTETGSCQLKIMTVDAKTVVDCWKSNKKRKPKRTIRSEKKKGLSPKYKVLSDLSF